jgi:hypothetical protein
MFVKALTMRRSMLLRVGSIALLFSFAVHAAEQPAADPMFTQPYVDADEWRDKPVRHRYVHGGFKGTEARFSYYFPPKDRYQGRFFQVVTPIPMSEMPGDSVYGADHLGFSLDSGAYFVQTNQGGMGATATPGAAIDPTIAGYRVNAAAAQYSRDLAAQMYGQHRPYGYPFGGSGGGFRTIGGMENTVGVWDGAVPFVIGSPMALPNVFTVRLHAMRVLHDKFPTIVDALEPGGSGDMYAGLDQEERDALLEATRMGFPPRAWFAHGVMGMGAMAILMDSVLNADPTYVDDFWKIPGYLGANPPESLRNARIQHRTKISKLIPPEQAKMLGLPMPQTMDAPGDVEAWRELQNRVPVALRLESMPAGNLEGATVLIKSGAAAGQSLPFGDVVGDLITIRSGYRGGDPRVLSTLREGDELQIDNSAFLAVQTYHRHQVPPTRDYYVWDQFRAADGKPLYPQRPVLQGPRFAKSTTGSMQSGRFAGKMIVIETLLDWDALPWQADWYRNKVKEALGPRLDDNFRLWYFDNAAHGGPPPGKGNAYLVTYVGALHQALLDVSAWVEKGVAPAPSTNYKIIDGQVQVPATAALRKGIQPIIKVTANGGARAEVAVDKPVEFTARIDVPPNTGTIVAAQWDFAGEGDYPVTAQLPATKTSDGAVTLKTTHAFSKPGTYFPVLRAKSQREGDAGTPHTQVHNLGRVRVIVR